MNYGGWQVHVIPLDDDFEHAPTELCWCKPEVTEDGVVVHVAQDGREAYERGERKAS